jgi:hypothetical protein
MTHFSALNDLIDGNQKITQKIVQFRKYLKEHPKW